MTFLRTSWNSGPVDLVPCGFCTHQMGCAANTSTCFNASSVGTKVRCSGNVSGFDNPAELDEIRADRLKFWSQKGDALTK